ncbi:MAG: TonB-dependent receptor [Pseudomonadota bacterium]|nr:TonB-dependent receptor [Pseudomonadota bacterium]
MPHAYAAVASSLLLLSAASAATAQPADPLTPELDTVAVEPLHAEATPTRPASPAPPTALEEIVVTAQKRKESLQEVPIAISAFTNFQLDARGISSVKDLGTAVPGLQFTDLAGYNLIYLRGVGTDAFIPAADPSIATYLDGVYFPSAHNMVQSFGALERIEVLRGPQGALFGRNSTGGAISIFTRTPGPEPEVSVQASYARFDDLKSRAHVSLPLGDSVAVSFSGFYNREDNYYTLVDNGDKELPQEIGKGGRVRLAFAPADNFRVVLTGLLARYSGTSTTTSVNTEPSVLGRLLTIPEETREYVVTADSTPSLTTDTQAWYGDATWTLPWLDIKLLGSHYYIDAYDYVYDYDGSNRPVATYGAESDYQEVETAELQFTSNDGSFGSRWLQWVAGAYYLRSEGGYDPGYLSLADSVVNLTPVLDALPPLLRNILDPLPIPTQLRFNFTGLIGAESYSGYAQATANVTDWLNVTAGGRYQEETRELIRSDVAIEGIDSSLISWTPRESTVTNFSPRIAIDIKPADSLMLYASYSQGFKSATYNIINIYLPPDYVEPEEVTSWELGLKSDWFERSVRLNVAAFESEIKNLQTGFVSLTTGGAINFENAGEARIRGIEFDATALPLPNWNPGLLLTVGGSWLDAIYTDYRNGSGYDEQTGLSFKSDCGDDPANPSGPRCRDFTGNRVVRTPKFSGSATLSQTIDVSSGSFEIGVDYYYNSGFYYLAQNSANSFEDSYRIVNGRVSYLHAPWNLRVTVFGENLIDERYRLAQFHTDFGRADTLAPPVTAGVRLNWEFGA